ncbi:MAG: hypothetical protein ABIL05_03155, partial [candidate division WOR-3 bacterium]
MKTTLILLLIFYSLSFARTSVEKIEAAFDRGEISFEQKILYKALSIKGRDHLPEYLKGDIYYEKCATPVIVEIYQNWEKLGTKTRDSIKVLLGRPSLPY